VRAVVAADADIFPPAHAVELFGLLSAPALSSTVIPFPDEPTSKGQ
jgi:hypothetical protein